MKTLKTVIGGLSMLILFCCTDEHFPIEKDYPVIETLPVSNIDETGINLNAEILGNHQLDDHGFIVNFSYFDDFSNESKKQFIPLGKGSAGPYTHRITSNLIEGFEYQIRGYGVRVRDTIYGNEITFTGHDVPDPQFTGVSQSVVFDGDVITISGTNLYSDTHGPAFVFIQEFQAEVLENTNTSITFKVPRSPVVGSVSIRVQIAGLMYTGGLINIQAVEIESVSNNRVFFGDTITLFGKGFTKYNSINITSDQIELNLIQVNEQNLVISVGEYFGHLLEDQQINFTIKAASKVQHFNNLLVAARRWEQLASLPANTQPPILASNGTHILAVDQNSHLFRLNPQIGNTWQRATSTPCGSQCAHPYVFTFNEKVFTLGVKRSDPPEIHIYECPSLSDCQNRISLSEKGSVYNFMPFKDFIYIAFISPQGELKTFKYNPGNNSLKSITNLFSSTEKMYTFNLKNQQYFINARNIFSLNKNTDIPTLISSLTISPQGVFTYKDELYILTVTDIFKVNHLTGHISSIYRGGRPVASSNLTAITHLDKVIMGSDRHFYRFIL